MTGQRNAVRVTPITAGVGKRFSKAVGNVVVIVVTRQRDLAVRQIPQKLGQVIDQRITVCCLEGVLQIVGPGQMHGLLAVCKAKRALTHKLRLVGKDGGDDRAKTIAYCLVIALVCDIDEFFNGCFIECIYVCLVIIPRGVACDLAPNCPKCTLDRIAILHLTVGFQAFVLAQNHVKFGNQYCVVAHTVSRVRGKGDIALTEGIFLGYIAAAKA